jgi:hypothetical protein
MKEHLLKVGNNHNLADEIERREHHNLMAPFPIFDTEIIEDLKKLEMITKKENYNNVPVTYCKTCLSLHVKDVTFPRSDDDEEEPKPEAIVGYCVPCGNTELESVQITEWEELYAEKYDEPFIKQRVNERVQRRD